MNLLNFIKEHKWKIIPYVCAAMSIGVAELSNHVEKESLRLTCDDTINSYKALFKEEETNIARAQKMMDNVERLHYLNVNTAHELKSIIDVTATMKAQEAEDRYAERVGNDLFPPILISPHITLDDYIDLDLLLDVEPPSTTSPQTMAANVCQLFTKYGKEFFAKGTCTFIANGYVLASYHQIDHKNTEVFEFPRSYAILTSRGDSIEAVPGPGQKIEVLAASPRDDLALLRVQESFEYIGSVCVSTNPASDLQNSTLVRYGTDPEHKGSVSVDTIAQATPTSFTGFGEKSAFFYKTTLATAPLHVKKGDSGSPIYKQDGCLVGLVQGADVHLQNGFSYTPGVGEFLHNVETTSR